VLIVHYARFFSKSSESRKRRRRARLPDHRLDPAVEAECFHAVHHAVVGFGVNAAVERRGLVGLVRGEVLAHERDVERGRNLIVQDAHDLDAVFLGAGQHEMPHEEPAPGDPILVADQITHLPLHFLKRRDVRVHVAGRVAVEGGFFRVRVLHVWHVDVNDPVGHPKRLDALEAAAVVNDRKAESLLDGQDERLRDGVQVVGGRDEVEVVALHALEHEEALGEFGVGDFGAVSELADGEILAELAAHGAVREEDGAGASVAADGGFLAVVCVAAGDAGENSAAAETELTGGAVHAALARAEPAGGNEGAQRLGAPGQFSGLHQSEIAGLEVFLMRHVFYHGIHGTHGRYLFLCVPYHYPSFRCFFSRILVRSSPDVISITQRRGDTENSIFDLLRASASLREVFVRAGSRRIRRVEIHDADFGG